MARSTVGYSDRIISSITGERRLFLYGANGTRYCERVDSNGRYIRGVLLEPAQNQLGRYSRAHNSWTLTRCSVPTTNATAPDGSATADVLHESAAADGNTTHFINASTTAALGSGTYVFYTFAAPINRSWICLVPNIGGTGGAWFDVTNGVVGSRGVVILASGMEKYSTYYLCWCTFSGPSAVANNGIYIAEADNDITFTGANQDSLYVWGTQCELGLYPSSHIINDGTGTVSRGVDGVVQRSIEPIYAGTLRLKVMLPSHTPAADTLIFHLVNAADSGVKYIKLWAESGTGKLKVTAQGGGSAIPTTVITDGKVHDLSIGFTPGLLAAWVDSGVAATSVFVPTAPLDRIEAQPCGGVIGDFTLWDQYMASGGGF